MKCFAKLLYKLNHITIIHLNVAGGIFNFYPALVNWSPIIAWNLPACQMWPPIRRLWQQMVCVLSSSLCPLPGCLSFDTAAASFSVGPPLDISGSLLAQVS